MLINILHRNLSYLTTNRIACFDCTELTRADCSAPVGRNNVTYIE